jgi:hypothetical protein
VEQELFTLPEHPSPPPIFSGVRVTRFLVLDVYFVDRCFQWPEEEEQTTQWPEEEEQTTQWPEEEEQTTK